MNSGHTICYGRCYGYNGSFLQDILFMGAVDGSSAGNLEWETVWTHKKATDRLSLKSIEWCQVI